MGLDEPVGSLFSLSFPSQWTLCVIDPVGLIISGCINKGIANHVGDRDRDLVKCNL